MSQLLHNYRYYPDVERSGWVMDQVSQDHQIQYMDYAHDGSSAYNMYAHNGKIRKSVPLTSRPPVNETYNGFKGTIVPEKSAPNFYETRDLYYYAPM